MSGISGCITIKEYININKLYDMTEIIKYRGPDDEGYYLYGNNSERFVYGADTLNEAITPGMYDLKMVWEDQYTLGLGYRGLRINEPFLDYHQPMSSDNKVIVFNGNIYNFKELKKELELLGEIFHTNTDTEIILKSYHRWGQKCVEHFNGDWAFAIWDKEKKVLFCSRDRLGIKPLYYFFDGGKFIFSSEIKQIIEYGIKAEVNEEVLFALLFYGVDNYSKETSFQHIYTLGAGENLEISMNDDETLEMCINKYWDISKIKAEGNENFESASNKIGLELEKSIYSRLSAGVEVGSCLSGGIDSSSIVTLVCEELDRNGIDTKDFKTVTACYDESKEVDERYYSDLIVSNSNCSNIKVRPQSDKLKNDLEKIIWHQDEPFSGFGIFASWCVMEAASKSGIKILLDGQGGDETLLGYERYYAYMILDKIKEFDIISAVRDFKLASKNSKLTKKMLFAYIIYFNNLYIRKKRLKKQNQQFLNIKFLDRFVNKDIIDSSLKLNSLEEAKLHAINSSLAHLLRYEDRNTMAHSIEARVPFLDHIFAEKAFGQDTEYKLKGGWTKANIRKYMEDKMPKEVTYRKDKLGFSVPKDKWINELNDFYLELLLKNPVSGDYFNIENIKLAFKNKTHADIRIKFIIVEIWMRTFIKPEEI